MKKSCNKLTSVAVITLLLTAQIGQLLRLTLSYLWVVKFYWFYVTVMINYAFSVQETIGPMELFSKMLEMTYTKGTPAFTAPIVSSMLALGRYGHGN